MKKTRNCIVIDAHGHPDWCGHDLEKTLANMDAYGIDKMWLLSWEAPMDECLHEFSTVPGFVLNGGTKGPIPFSRCISYAERAPGKFILGHAPDPRRPQAIDEMQAAIEIYGVKVCGELKLRMMYDNPDAIRLYRFCGTRNVPVLMHFDYDYDSPTVKYPRPCYWQGGGINVLERVLEKCPETNFLGHAPGFWGHLSGDDKYKTERYPAGPIVPGGKVLELLRKFPNLYCDMSAGSAIVALKRDVKFSCDFLIEFQDRLLYARDCFGNEHQEFIDSLNLPEEVQRKVYGQNAEKLLSK